MFKLISVLVLLSVVDFLVEAEDPVDLLFCHVVGLLRILGLIRHGNEL